jgi:hypothetical protein
MPGVREEQGGEGVPGGLSLVRLYAEALRDVLLREAFTNYS